MTSRFFDYGPGDKSTPAAAATPVVRGILQSLTPQEWTHLVGFTARLRYPSGKQIVTAGATPSALYFLVNGSVRIVQPKPGGMDAEAGVLNNGAVFGIYSFVENRPSIASAIAIADTELLSLTPVNFSQLASWHPRIAVTLMGDLAANLASRLASYEVMT